MGKQIIYAPGDHQPHYSLSPLTCSLVFTFRVHRPFLATFLILTSLSVPWCLICSPVSTAWCLASQPSLSVPITHVLVQASLLLGHFSGLLTSLATPGLCLFTVSDPSSGFPMSEGTHVWSQSTLRKPSKGVSWEQDVTTPTGFISKLIDCFFHHSLKIHFYTWTCTCTVQRKIWVTCI